MVIVWRVTTSCNMGCGFCAFDSRLNRERPEADPEHVKAFAELLGAWGNSLNQPPMVSWMGGEPLRWPPLKELTLVLHRKFGLRISATTNGTPLADGAMRRHIIENYEELTFSVDGIGKIHNNLRNWPDGYHWIAKHIRMLVKEKTMAGAEVKLRANVVVMRDNIEYLERLCNELAGWGIEEISFNQLGGRDRPEFYATHRLLPEHAKALGELLPRLKQTSARQGFNICGTESYLDRIWATAIGRRCPVDDCRPGRFFLFINEAGKAAPCDFTVAECGIPIDTITSVEDLAGLPQLFSNTISEDRPPACADCMSTQVFGKFKGL